MSNDEETPPTLPSGRPANDDSRTPSQRRLAAHEDAIAELREETGRHAKTLFAHTNELDDLRAADHSIRKATEKNMADVSQFSNLAIEVSQELKLNNQLQRESNALKRRQEAQLEKGVEKIIKALRSPRVLGAITLGGAAAGFVIALIQWITQ